jgi:hypothetical protein
MTRQDQIRHAILRNQEIADLSALREKLLQRVSCPVSFHLQNRRKHLRPFLPFFQRILDEHASSPRLRSLAANLALARRLEWPLSLFRDLPSTIDRRFNEPDDLLEPIFAAIFEEPAILRQWMKVLDAQVEVSSCANLERTDQAAQAQWLPFQKDVVLVGGGPLTSIVASILGPLFHVTVITEQRALGMPWRNRPLFLNSSAAITDVNAPGLPLLGGSTTRVIGNQQLDLLDTGLLLGTETKAVRCLDGTSVEYASGFRFGDLIATDIVLCADDFFVNQRVEVDQLHPLTDGSIQLTLMDTNNGSRRLIRARAVFFLTGPGHERSGVPDALSQEISREATNQLEVTLQQLRQQIWWYRDALARLEAEPSGTAEIHVQRQWMRERIRQQMHHFTLPRILTLTALEQLYAFWRGELGADPACFPLMDLIGRSRSVALIGNGDTARILKELLDARGPDNAYPPRYKGRAASVRATFYNEVATSPQEYDQMNRRRYQGIFTPNTTALPFKAKQYRLTMTGNGKSRVEVTHLDEQGKRRRRRYEYAFEATGLERSPLEQIFPTSCSIQTIRDLEGNLVARGNADLRVFLCGAAAGLTMRELPEGLQRILEILEIPENSISLWVNGLLAERLAYTYAATQSPTKHLPHGTFGNRKERW